MPAACATSWTRRASREAAHAAQLDIDDAAGAQPDGLFGVVRGADALVQADGRLQLRLQRRRGR